MREQLTTTEAATRLGVTRDSVVKWIQKGHLKAEKHGRDYVVQASDLEQFERRPVGRPRKGEGE